MSAEFSEYKLSHLPSVADYVDGLAAIAPSMSEAQHRLLVEQYAAPDHTATATQLAQLTGLNGHQVVSSQYGKLGHRFCNEIDFKPDVRKDGTYRWWTIWSSGYPTPAGYLWKMLPQVVEALEILGWVGDRDFRLAEEVHPRDGLREGAVRRVSVNAYERNRVARQKCIERHGTKCSICSFDFGAVYGPLADGFIHVHHLVPLSDVGSEYEVEPEKHLRPVCPNCHAVIHLSGVTRSIEEVAQLLRST